MKIRIDKHSLRNLLFFTILFPLPILEQLNDVFDIIIKVLQIMVLILCMLLSLRELRHLMSYEKWLLLYCGYAVFLTVVFFNHRSLTLIRVMGEIVFPIISELLFFKVLKRNFRNTVKYIALYYRVLIIINFAVMLIYPYGIVRSSVGASAVRVCWIFGSKNNIVYILPIILFFITEDMLINGSGNIKFFITVIILSISSFSMGSNGFQFGKGSSAAIVMIIMFIAILIMGRLWRALGEGISKILSIKNIAIGSFIGSFIIVFISQHILSSRFLELLLIRMGKDLRFSGRNTVWERCIELIKHNPIFGSPDTGGYYVYSRSYMATDIEYNFWLSVMVPFGIVGVFIVFGVFFSLKYDGYSQAKLIAEVSFMLIMISGLVDTPSWKAIVLVLAVLTISENELSIRNLQMNNNTRPEIGYS